MHTRAVSLGTRGVMSHRTAMKRRNPSAPARWLYSYGYIKGRALDFGCGHGMDAKHYDMETYDPYWHPDMPTGLFDTIICVYVLNVVAESTQWNIVERIQDKLTKDGKAYFAVRRDIKSDRRGKGCIQRRIELPFKSIKKTSGFEIYEVTKCQTVKRSKQS